MITWTPKSTNPEHAAREVISTAMWIHSTFKNEIWLWRGQASKEYGVQPGMHTRVLRSDLFDNTEETVQLATAELIKNARSVWLDRHESVRLPDLALLAHLQHHGAATPLLDVTTDPLIALWMVAFADPSEPGRLDNESGLLLGIKKPPSDRWIKALDTRPYSPIKMENKGEKSAPSISEMLEENGKVWWYEAPDVTERLRIQRGSFLLGFLRKGSYKTRDNTLPMENNEDDWVIKRIHRRGQRSNTTRSKSDVFGIVVRGKVKRELRKLLTERSGLSVESIYPTPWKKPYIEMFAKVYSRDRDLRFDLPSTNISSSSHGGEATSEEKLTRIPTPLEEP